MMILIWLVLVLLFPVSEVRASALSDTSNAMPPGSWATLSTNNTSILRVGNSTGTMMPYSMGAVWDSTARKVQYLGNDHGYPNGLRHVAYDEATNSWQFIGENIPGLTAAHGYEHLAINAFTKDLYHRKYSGFSGTYQIYRCTAPCSSAAWTLWTTISATFDQVGEATGFWSGTLTGATNGVGAYIIYNSGAPNGQVFFTNPSTGSVFATATGFGGASTYHSFFEYSSVKNVAVFGGGNDNPRKVWRLNSDRSVTALTDSPVDLGIQRGFVAVDPVTGNFMIKHGSNLYQLNPDGTGTYTLQTGARVPPASVGNPASPALASMFVVPIDTYGVTMYVTCSGSSCSVDLYKHSAVTGGDQSSPTVNVTSPVANPPTTSYSTTSSTVNFAGTCTDNLACVSVTWQNDRGGSGTATGTSSFTINNIPLQSGANQITIIGLDAAGNPGSRVTAVQYTPPGTGGDFASRCAAVGVIKCKGFDAASDINGTWGVNPHGAFANQGQPRIPALDTAIKASGNGAMKFTLLPGETGAAAGQFFQNFSDNLQTQFGENQTFFMQFRMRIDTNFHNALKGFAGAKQMIMGAGSRPGTPQSSCTQLELVLQNNANAQGAAGLPQMYHNCGDYAPITDGPLSSAWNGNDFKVQNARANPFCWYYTPSYAQKFPPTGNCFPYYENEWMTFKFAVNLGPRGSGSCGSGKTCFNNSRVRMWVGRDGLASEAVIDKTMNLHSDNSLDKYGQVWFLPYSGGDKFPNGGQMWIDELIISTEDINDPGITTGGDLTPPTIQISSPVPPTFSTTSSTVDLSGTASDNIGVASVSWVNDRGGSGLASGTTTWAANNIVLQLGANVITATAVDAAGNSTPAQITITRLVQPTVAGIKFGVGAIMKQGPGAVIKLGQ